MYRDDFYTVGNIIGFTGSAVGKGWKDAVTVYFENDQFVGRITQMHDDRTNIGREAVADKAAVGYVSGNIGSSPIEPRHGAEMLGMHRPARPSKMRLEVRFAEGDERTIHLSRNQLTELAHFGNEEAVRIRRLLSQAIYAFPHLKERYPRGTP